MEHGEAGYTDVMNVVPIILTVIAWVILMTWVAILAWAAVGDGRAGHYRIPRRKQRREVWPRRHSGT
jgi:hypothetical protein